MSPQSAQSSNFVFFRMGVVDMIDPIKTIHSFIHKHSSEKLQKTNEKAILEKIKLLPLSYRREICISKLMFNKLEKNTIKV